MDPCNSDANQKTFFTDLKIKFLHQLVVYPAQLGNLFFMLPLSDISVFPLMFGLVANLPMSIFVLSRKNAFTNATDYVIFFFFFFFLSYFGFLLLLGNVELQFLQAIRIFSVLAVIVRENFDKRPCIENGESLVYKP